jgi:uncharacterized protein (TIGR02231 family)
MMARSCQLRIIKERSMAVIESKVVDVAVFPDRARVTRRGSLTLGPGIHHIDFSELPLTLQPDSVRASGRGTPAALLGVDTRREYFVDTPTAAVRELEKQIEALTDQDKALADQESAADVQLQFAKRLAEQAAEQLARGIALGRTNVELAGALIAFTSQKVTDAQFALRERAQKRRELARQLSKLNNELNAYRSARPRERFLATVEVEVKKSGELMLDLVYTTSGAGWQALYDIRATSVESDAAALQLGYLAQVTQNTGEDWPGTGLTLSTARPALAGIQPELEPWYLEPYNPPPPRTGKRAMPAMAMAPASRATGGAYAEEETAMAPQQMEAPGAAVNSEGASVTFRLAQDVTIPSDGAPHKVTIAALELRPRLDFLSVPKLAEVAFRRTKATNSSDYLLLPGEANLFVEGDFIGTHSLDRIAPNEEFELALGVDDRVLVKRELKARAVDKSFIGERRRLHVGYEIELRNLRANKIDVEVRDQLPVSRHEQIKIKLENIDPKASQQSELNELTWNLTLSPNEKRFLRFDFTVEYPVAMTIAGLP